MVSQVASRKDSVVRASSRVPECIQTVEWRILLIPELAFFLWLHDHIEVIDSKNHETVMMG